MNSRQVLSFFSDSFGGGTKYEEVPADDKFPVENDPPTTRPKTRPLLSILTCAICIVLGFGLGVAASFLNQRILHGQECWVPAPLSPIPSEVLAPRIDKVFNPDSRYIGPSAEVDENWKSLVDSEKVWIGDPERYNLPKGIKRPPQYAKPKDGKHVPDNFYFVSNLHQVHCLNMIRKRYWDLLLHGYDPGSPGNEEWAEHVDHCVEYLRLGITCGDLLVVEPDSPPDTPPELTAGGLGWGVTHRCIDFDRLKQFQWDQESLYNQSIGLPEL